MRDDTGINGIGQDAGRGRRPRVLIVDDDEHLVGNLTLWLERDGIDVLKAFDGNQAFQILRNSPTVDLVLTDFMMPNLNGLELLRLLKSNAQLFDTKVLVMSNNSNFEFRKRAIENGAVDYILKEAGARAISEAVLRLGGFQAAPNAAATTASERNVEASSLANQRLREIAIFSEGLLDLLRIAGQIDTMPPAAVTALESVERIARQIQIRAGSPSH